MHYDTTNGPSTVSPGTLPLIPGLESMMERNNLLEHVRQNFGFLITEFGFQIANEETIGDSLSVEYRSDRVYVRVLRTVPDFEFVFVLGRLDSIGSVQSESFDWSDVGALDCCCGWKWQRSEDQPFAGRLVQLARLLRDCGSDVLRAKDNVFDEMRHRRAKLKEQHLREETAHAIRSRVEVAWKNKDFREVKRLYEAIVGELSEVERKKLDHAVRHLGDDQRCASDRDESLE